MPKSGRAHVYRTCFLNFWSIVAPALWQIGNTSTSCKLVALTSKYIVSCYVYIYIFFFIGSLTLKHRVHVSRESAKMLHSYIFLVHFVSAVLYFFLDNAVCFLLYEFPGATFLIFTRTWKQLPRLSYDFIITLEMKAACDVHKQPTGANNIASASATRQLVRDWGDRATAF